MDGHRTGAAGPKQARNGVMIPGGSMILRHRYGVHWKDLPFEEMYNAFPKSLGQGSIYDVVVFDRHDPLAPIKDADPTDPADVFVSMVRAGFRSASDLYVALQHFSRIEGETWAVILRDALAEQLADEGEPERHPG